MKEAKMIYYEIPLSDEQIMDLLEWFVSKSETRKKYSDKRKKACELNNKWLQPDVITNLSDAELTEKFLEYYKTGGERQNLNQIYRARIIRNIQKFRDTILYLLDENIGLSERINEILSPRGKCRIKGFGKAIATSILMDYKPDRYCVWNNKTEMGFAVLGWDPFESKSSHGEAYIKVLEALRKLIELRPDLNLSFDDVDLFLHTIAAEEEGIKEIERITKKGDGVQGVTPAQTTEFVMEKYLEEFIAENFKKLSFDAKLKLYQDEESTGRQYPTSVGFIDLLAFDEEHQEYVVIELKKGRSSDAVVGQILRYMGWVRENIAQGKKVRGIIITKEVDEKLKYALKEIRNVNLLTYEIKFDLKKQDY